MLHLNIAVLSCCLLCGVFVVYYVSLYILVPVIIALLLLLFYESQVNILGLYARGFTRLGPLRTVLISPFRLWAHSYFISIMKTCKELMAVSQRFDTNEINKYGEGCASTSTSLKTSHGNCVSNSFLTFDEENTEENNRRNSFSPYYVSAKSNDSFNNNRSHDNRIQRRSLNQTPNRYSHVSDLSFSPKGSPWGTTVSPKLRSSCAGVKTVQTVAGPLLASTRFNININSRMYGDVNSPGFSSRVAQYASENKTWTHQKQYMAPGQFPLVQLNHSASKLPIISSCKSQRVVYSPVMVRIAPPEILDANTIKSQILGPSSPQEEQPSSKSMLEVLKEMSRKRIHAQLDDSEDADAIKRQRKGEGQSPSDGTQLQNDHTSIGKRARDDSPNHGETTSRPYQQLSKRTRNNEIWSSLSSSRNLFNHMKNSTKRKSSTGEWSRSSTPDLEKQPKQPRDGSVEIASIPRSEVETPATSSSVHTPIATSTSSTTRPALPVQRVEKSSENMLSIKPSEFLPKFAAVLNKSTSPSLTSVAALEAKRAYDSRTRLRSMLAVIAGEDDFIKVKEPVTSGSEVVTSTTEATMTTASLSIFSSLPAVTAVGDVSTSASVGNTPATSITSSTSAPLLTTTPTIPVQMSTSTQVAPSKSPFSSGSISFPAPSTSAAYTNFGLLGSVTSSITPSLETSTSSSPAVTVSSAGTKMAIPISTSSSPMSAELLFSKSGSSTTSSFSPTFNFGKSVSSNGPISSTIPKTSVVDVSVAASAPNLGTNNVIKQGELEAASQSSSLVSCFSNSSVDTVIENSKQPAVETSKSLFQFGNAVTIPTTTVIAGVGFTSGSVQSSQSNFMTTTTAAVSTPSLVPIFGAAKSTDNSPPTSSTMLYSLGENSATKETSSPFQLNTASSSVATPQFGGFKYEFSSPKMKENSSVGVPQAHVSTVPLLTNVSTSAPVSVPIVVTTSAPVTSTTTTATSSASTVAVTSTSQSTSLLSFGASADNKSGGFAFGKTSSWGDPKPIFNLNSTNIVNGPTQNVITSSQSQTDGATQKGNLFTFGVSSSSQSTAGSSSFGSSSTTNGIKHGGFAFPGSGALSSSTQPSSSMFGSSVPTSTQSSSGVFSSSDQPSTQQNSRAFESSKSSIAVFGNPGSSSGVFGSTMKGSGQEQPNSGIFGSGQSVFGSGASLTNAQSSGGIFGNVPTSQPSGGIFRSVPTSQSSGGIFGSASATQSSAGIFGNLPTTQPSSGIFGSVATTQPSGVIFGSTQTTQPSGVIFGSTQTTQSSGGIFGSTQTTQSSGGIFGTAATIQPPGGIFGSTQTTQPSGGIFGSAATTQSSGGIFGSTQTTQPSGGMFGSAATTQPSGSIFGSVKTTQPPGGIFGNQSTAQSPGGLFGSNTQPSSNVFGSVPTTQSTGGMFSSSSGLPNQSSAGLFGSSAQATQSSSSTFGNSMTHPSGGIFSNSGTPSSSSQPTANIFGGGGAQQTGATFGAGGDTQPVFGFGSSTSQQPVAGSSGGLFGSTSVTPFQFGAGSAGTTSSASQPSGGFNFGNSGLNPPAPNINFSAGSSGSSTFQFGAGTTPAFGSQTPGQGMFSIGSGSTAPRARSSRVRRQK